MRLHMQRWIYKLLFFVILCAVSGGHGVSAQAALPTILPDMPKPADSALLSQTVSDITVEITRIGYGDQEMANFTENPTAEPLPYRNVVVDACFTKPDDGEWFLYADLTDGFEFGETNAISINSLYDHRVEIQADGKKMGEDCKRFYYLIPADQKITFPLMIRFRHIFTLPREGMGTCENFLYRVKTSPAAQTAGIQATCDDVQPLSEWTSSQFAFNLVSYDSQKATQQEANQILRDIQAGIVYGPWIFTIEGEDLFSE